MSTANLNHLFQPTSIAVIAAAEADGVIGAKVMENLLSGGFKGPIMPITAKAKAVRGVLAYGSVADLPLVPDLAVVCSSAQDVPAMIEALCASGCRAATILTAGLATSILPDGVSAKSKVLSTAKRHGMRLLGANCLGLMVPSIGLNASFAHRPVKPGKLAFVSQSGALSTAVLDWAADNDIGFSYFISLGESDDVDFDDVIDFLGSDPYTRAILLYVETVHERRNFMSAARAAARNKPILCVKSGRFAEGAIAAGTHTGAMTGSDEIFDAALRRAGILRVYTIEEMFHATETLARMKPILSDDMAIITNGGGIGVLAVDSLIEKSGTLSELKPETVAKLDSTLPCTWSHANPIDINDDADGARYGAVIDTVLEDKSIGSLLVMHAPTAVTDPSAAAQGVIKALANRKRNMLTAWVGGGTVRRARQLFHDAGIPTFETPEQAIGAWQHMVEYKQLQELLMETPPSVPEEFEPNTKEARRIIHAALHLGRSMLTEPEAKAVLECYGIHTCHTETAETVAEAMATAEKIGFPVALKILSDDITHKSDIGGVALHLSDAQEVSVAGTKMLEQVAQKYPEARIKGFTVQEMVDRTQAQELIVGSTVDPVFGPVIMFGDGGQAVEVRDDTTLGLPPLNMTLARDMIGRTRVSKLLAGYRNVPAVDMTALEMALVRTSHLLIELGEVVELDMNPLLADRNGVVVLDARIKVEPMHEPAEKRLAIRPYPKELEKWLSLGKPDDLHEYLLRPIRPEDEPDHYEFMRHVSREDIHFRFFGSVRELPHTEMARLTQLDYDREMAFVARFPEDSKRGTGTAGVVRVSIDANNENAEYAILIRSNLKGHGLGRTLMLEMIEYCRNKGVKNFVGQVLTDNRPMLTLCERLGFKRKHLPEEEVYEVILPLQG